MAAAERQKPQGGITASVLRLVGSLVRHIEALGALFREEVRDAAGHGLRILVFLLLALLFLAFGYVFSVLFVAFLLAWAFGVSWIWITLLLAIAHLLLVLVCAVQIKSAISRRWFAATGAELKKDLMALRGESAKPSADTESR